MKKRIIPAILLKGGTNVLLSQSFTPWRTVGVLTQQLRLHLQRQCDELLIINLDQAGTTNFSVPQRLISLVRQMVDVPISYVGGISNADDASRCINSGFDKIYVTSSFLECPSVVRDIADVVGTQSIGVCLPYRRLLDSSCLLWNHSTKNLHSMALHESILLAISQGAGEILLFNVDLDGSMTGLDSHIFDELLYISPTVPILVAGGAGTASHFLDALMCPYVQGVVASSVFSLTQETPATIRLYCEQEGLSMRRISFDL